MFSSFFGELFPTKLENHTLYTAEWFVVIKHKSGSSSLYAFKPFYVFLVEGSQTVEEYSKIDLTSEV